MVLVFLNALIDTIVPIYSILSVIIVVIFVYVSTKNKDHDENITVDYVYKKKEAINEPPNWKTKFHGKWTKIERDHMYEVLKLNWLIILNEFLASYRSQFVIFNGQSSFMANLVKDRGSDHTFFITRDGDQYYFQLLMEGVPPGEIKRMPIGKDAASKVKVENQRDSRGYIVDIAAYVNEETETFFLEVTYTNDGKKVTTSRHLRDDDHMVVRADAIKLNGEASYFTAVYKRV